MKNNTPLKLSAAALALVMALPAFADIEKRLFDFKECRKSSEFDCRDRKTKDSNLARVYTTDEDGNETEQYFDRWTPNGYHSLQIDALKEKDQLGSEEQIIAENPLMADLNALGPDVFERAIEVMRTEKANNPKSIIRLKWISFDWENVVSERMASITTQKDYSHKIPTYFTLMYGPTKSSMRVIGYVEISETVSTTQKFPTATFVFQNIVPEVAGDSAKSGENFLDGLGALIGHGVGVGTYQENRWTLTKREMDLVEGVGIPFLKVVMAKDEVFVQEAIEVIYADRDQEVNPPN